MTRGSDSLTSHDADKAEKALPQSQVHDVPVVEKSKFEEENPEEAIATRFGAFGPFLARLFANGVEARGVERVPEDQRETKNMWNKFVALS